MTVHPNPEPRSFEPGRTIQTDDPEDLERWARYFGTTAEIIAEAIDHVGPKPMAVELWLSAPAT